MWWWMASVCLEAPHVRIKDGGPTHKRAVVEDGGMVRRARRRKEATHPELVGRLARARLVVLGGEVEQYPISTNQGPW